jgi:hypothetical protein
MALAVVSLVLVTAAAAATPPSGVTSNDFETNTAGWFNFNGSITREQNGFQNPGLGYANASGINAATGTGFAVLNRGPCSTDLRGSGPSLLCTGPYTDWGNLNNNVWNGTYTTHVDIYLDTAYAIAHPDLYNGNTRDGNIAGLSNDAGGNPLDSNVPGTRFDFASAINSSAPLDGSGNATFLRDYGFNVSTGTGFLPDGTTPCAGFVVDARTNTQRQGANPNVSSTSKCIAESGWYTFKNVFSQGTSYLDVAMSITKVGSSTPAASWDLTGFDANGTYGCNRYGWFSDQEIYGLPIDNSRMTGGCAAPVITKGQILPTGTTCQAYGAGATSLNGLLYTLKNGVINSVSPGVFFYYGTVTGTAGQSFTITQTANPSGAPLIPIQHGQIILYDTNCNVVTPFVHSDANGVATGTLPSTGTFIISVKYSPLNLKGQTSPGTVTYTIGGGPQITLAPK